MSVLYVKIVKIHWRMGVTPQTPLVPKGWGFHPQAPGGVPSPLCQILGCATGDDLFHFLFPKQCGPRLQNFFQYGPSCKKFAHPWALLYPSFVYELPHECEEITKNAWRTPLNAQCSIEYRLQYSLLFKLPSKSIIALLFGELSNIDCFFTFLGIDSQP